MKFAIISVARVAVAWGEPATAARILGAVDAQLELEGAELVFADRIERDAIVALIDAASATSAADRKAGRETSLEQAVELALELLRRPR
jgi:hypothetical protein